MIVKIEKFLKRTLNLPKKYLSEEECEKLIKEYNKSIYQSYGNMEKISNEEFLNLLSKVKLGDSGAQEKIKMAFFNEGIKVAKQIFVNYYVGDYEFETAMANIYCLSSKFVKKATEVKYHFSIYLQTFKKFVYRHLNNDIKNHIDANADLYNVGFNNSEMVSVYNDDEMSKGVINDTELIDMHVAYKSLIKKLIDVLTPKQRRILSLRYNSGYTLEEIGAMYNVTKENVRQIEQKSLREIRQAVVDIDQY